MNVIDLSHGISAEMSVYPGTEAPLIEEVNNIEESGFSERKISLFSHTGTHIDAPSHMLKTGKHLGQFNVGYFIGAAGVIDFSNINRDKITKDVLEGYGDYIDRIEYLIISTGWSAYWGTDDYFAGYPTLTVETIRWLNDNFNLRGLGVDAISVDHWNSNSFPIHMELFKKGKIIIENLTNLDSLLNKKFTLSCLPLKIDDADGSPTRAIAILE